MKQQTPPTNTEYVEPNAAKTRQLIEAAKSYSSHSDGVVTMNNPALYKAFRAGQESAIAILENEKSELAKALQDAVAFAEKCYKADKDSADWYNNNTPGVGQKLDYQSYPPLPKWAEHAKQVLKQAGLTE